MATQLNFYSNTDVSIIDLMNTEDANFIGKHQVSLTNYDNASLPAIAAGSIVENNGALFKFTVETAISGSAVDGTNYILLIPSGDPSLGTADVTPTWSQTAPTWSDSKQGWYGTGGSANYRYTHVLRKDSAVYECKRAIKKREMILELKFSFASGDVSKTIAHGISNAFTNNRIRNMIKRVNTGAVSNQIILYWTSASPQGIDLVYVNDTNIVAQRTTTGQATTCYVILEYV